MPLKGLPAGGGTKEQRAEHAAKLKRVAASLPQYVPYVSKTNAVDRLPDSIRIAGFNFTIEKWELDRASAAGRYGECSSMEQTIRIQRHMATPQKAVDTFLHEVLHALYWAYGVKDADDEERTVGALSTALMTCHRDNPWLTGWIDEALRP